MPNVIDPLQVFQAEVRFLATGEGGRKSAVRPNLGSYRPKLRMTGDQSFHGTVFMTAPDPIMPGDTVKVEFVLWCHDALHDAVEPGQAFELWEADAVATGTILSKCFKKNPWVAADDTSATTG